MRKLLISAALAAITSIAISDTGMAQQTGTAPFCVSYYTSSNIITRCEYSSFEQCQALNDGRNNTCSVNPYYKQQPSGSRRGY